MRAPVSLFLLALLAAYEVAAQPATAEVSNADVATLRGRLEAGMTTLGELGNEARRETDLVQATCVLEAQERAAATMELATTELLVLGDASAGSDAHAFALEKLRAAVERLDGLVNEARGCAGDGGPEAVEDEANVEVITPRSIPLADPTQGLGGSPAPPALDGGWVPSASPTE